MLFDASFSDKIFLYQVNHLVEHCDGLIYQGQHQVAIFFVVEPVDECFVFPNARPEASDCKCGQSWGYASVRKSMSGHR